MNLKKKKGQKVDASFLLRRENKTLKGGNAKSNRGAGIKDHSAAASPGEPPHMQPPNPSTIADAKKYLLEGTR